MRLSETIGLVLNSKDENAQAEVARLHATGLVAPLLRYVVDLRGSHFAQWSLEKSGRKFSHENRTMSDADGRGLDWKECADVLDMTRAVARATFWREIKPSRSKKGESPPPAIVIQRETDSDTLKGGKPTASR
jgi:hypothetical protein